MKLKYVVLDDCYPILFGEYFKHSDMASLGRITSAGFVSLGEVETPSGSRFCSTRMLKASVYGKSVSLGIGVNQESDERQIETMLND